MSGRDIVSMQGAAWHIHAFDTDVDAGLELIEETAVTHSALTTADQIEILSAEALDITQTVKIHGIDADGNKASETMALDGTDGTTPVLSVNTYQYFDYAKMSAEATGAVTIQEEGDTDIVIIPIGSVRTNNVQHFNGEYASYITGFSGGIKDATGGVNYELRVYPSAADCIDPTDGFEVVERLNIDKAVTSPMGDHRTFDPPIRVEPGSWICVYGIGSDVNANGFASITGFDYGD